MTGDRLLAILDAFAADAKLYTLLALIALDVLFAVAEAIKAKSYEWYRLADFYRTMIVPYLIGYFALYVFVGLGVGLETLLGTGIVTTAFGTLAASLVGSVLSHAREIGFPFGSKAAAE